MLGKPVEQVIGTHRVLEVIEEQIEAAGVGTEVVHGHDRRPVPVAAVGQHRGLVIGDDRPRAEAELGRLSPAADQSLEPVEQ